jgi:hypothetical protein
MTQDGKLHQYQIEKRPKEETGSGYLLSHPPQNLRGEARQ